MSDQNAETVRLAYEHLNWRDVDALAGLCHDEFVIDMTERVFNPDTYRGRDGMRRFFDGVKDLWETYNWELKKTVVADDVVVAMLHCEGRGRGGVRVEWDVAWLWTFRQGTPVSLRLYRDPLQALEAAGLADSPSATLPNPPQTQ